MAVKRAFKDLRIANPLVIAKNGVAAPDLLRGRNGCEKLPPRNTARADRYMAFIVSFEGC
jgi:hypothetical protein